MSDAQSPDVVEGADQDNRPFAKLGESGLGGGDDAEGLVLGLEIRGGAGEGDDVGEGEIAGVMEADVELLRLGRADGSFEVVDGLGIEILGRFA